MTALLPGAPRSVEAAEFWDAMADGRLLVQQCVHCGRWRAPRTVTCPDCGCWDSRWLPPPGPARLVTCTVVRRAPSAEWGEHAPYGVAIVEPAPGCRLLAGTDWLPDAADLGRPVVVTVVAGEGGPRLVASRAEEKDTDGAETTA